MNAEIKMKATGLIAALIVSIIGLVLIAMFGTTELAKDIAASLKIITGILAGGLVVDLAFVKRKPE